MPKREGLLAALVDLLRAWWRVDRIRASPREGRLLRLEVADFLTVRGEPARVVARRVGVDAEGRFVAYRCETAAGERELRARPRRGRGCALAWGALDGPTCRLDEVEIVVFSPARTDHGARGPPS